MNGETKTCQNCKSSFVVGDEDLQFYTKMGVEAPAICPPCGIQRTMAWRNEHTLYNGVCKKCGKKTLSMYHPNSPYVVYCHDCWWSDAWDGAEYAQEFNPNRGLIEQWIELQKKVPREALVILNSENCSHSNHVRHSKNCYMGNLITWCEDLYYCEWMVRSRDCIDCKKTNNSEFCYECIDVSNCSSSAFLQDSADCNSCFLSYDLKGCTDCILCSNLRNKSNYILNKSYSKEEYEKKKKEILNGSYITLKKYLDQWRLIRDKALRRYAQIYKSNSCTGNFIDDSNRLSYCFDAMGCEDIKASASLGTAKGGAYSYSVGFPNAEMFFGSCVLRGGNNIKFSFNAVTSNDCAYLDSSISCQECIACVGLKNKKYCILNKQYSKEDYFKLKDELMKKGQLAIFPDSRISTFKYNESAAQTQFPLEKQEALRQGYAWEDDIPATTGKETIKPEEVSDNISDVTDSILKEVFKCISCGRNYRIVQREFDYYKRFNLPLPRECSPCRMLRRRNDRMPYRLWHRQCQCEKNHVQHGAGRCPNEFETSYAPERPEIIYCEACYQNEVV